MTYLRFMRCRNFWFSLLAITYLSSCSTIHDYFWPPEEENQAESPTRTKRKEKKISSSFEWAVQNYEAGSYKEAIRQFLALHKAGADVPGYEMIPFYLGMSYWRMGDNAQAKSQLETFLQSQPKGREGVEARVALLLIYEMNQQWGQVVALAAETDKLQVFQENRALLKLVWARALRENGELLGARAAIKDAKQFLENTPEEGAEGKEIWGRYHYVEVITQIQECATLGPKQVGKKKLYSTWLESESSCWLLAYQHALEVFRFDNAWSPQSEASLSNGTEKLSAKIKANISEVKSLEPKRNLQKVARQNMYRLLEAIDRDLKVFKERALNAKPLERLRKQIDHLLVTF